MNSDQKDAKTKKTPPPRKRKALLALLILCAMAGCVAGVYFLSRSSSVFGVSIKKNLDKFPVKSLKHLSTLLQKKVLHKEPDIKLTFQGTLTGEQGAIALINDQMVAVGAEINGVQIVEIDNRKLIIKYCGESQTLTMGETVSITRE